MADQENLHPGLIKEAFNKIAGRRRNRKRHPREHAQHPATEQEDSEPENSESEKAEPEEAEAEEQKPLMFSRPIKKAVKPGSRIPKAEIGTLDTASFGIAGFACEPRLFEFDPLVPVIDLGEQNQRLQRELEASRQREAERNRALTNLQTQYNTDTTSLRAKGDKYEKLHAELQVKYETLDKTATSDFNKISDEEKKADAANQEAKAARDELKAANTEKDKKEEEIRQLQDQLEDAIAEKNKADETSNQRRRDLEDKARELNLAETHLQNTIADLRKAEQDTQNLRVKYDAECELKDGAHRAYDKLEDQVEGYKAQIEGNSQAKKDIDNALEIFQTVFRNLGEGLTLNDYLDHIRYDAPQLGDDNNWAGHTRGDRNVSGASLSDEIPENSMDDDFETNEDQEDLQSKRYSADQPSMTTGQDAELLRLTTENAELTAAATRNIAEVETLKRELNKVQSAMESKKIEIQKLHTTAGEQTAKFNSLKAQLAELTVNHDNKKAEIERLKTAAKEHATKSLNSNTQSDNNNKNDKAELKRLKKAAEQHAIDLATLNEQIHELNQEKENKDTEITRLKTERDVHVAPGEPLAFGPINKVFESKPSRSPDAKKRPFLEETFHHFSELPLISKILFGIVLVVAFIFAQLGAKEKKLWTTANDLRHQYLVKATSGAREPLFSPSRFLEDLINIDRKMMG